MRLLICCLAVIPMLTPPQQRRPTGMELIKTAIGGFEGTAGLYARNLLTGEELAHNADLRFPTASTIKTAVMVEVYQLAAEGKLSLDDTLTLTDAVKVGGSGVLNGLSAGLPLKVRDLLHLMIVLSDNTATNLLVDRIGAKQIDDRLASQGFKDTRIFRATFRDGRAEVHPELEKEFGLGMASPREMGRLMAAIAEGKAVNGEASKAMFTTLMQQQDRAMIPRLLPRGLRIGNKTGTDSEKTADAAGHRGAIRADAAIVQGDGVHYVIAVFTRRGKDTQGGVENAGVRLGAELARLVHAAWTTKADSPGPDR